MRENTLKRQLYAGEPAFGVMCTFPSPPVVEMLGHLGFDWILLDNEHGSITVDSAEACIAAAELTGMAPIVRPVANKPEIIALNKSDAIPQEELAPLREALAAAAGRPVMVLSGATGAGVTEVLRVLKTYVLESRVRPSTMGAAS